MKTVSSEDQQFPESEVLHRADVWHLQDLPNCHVGTNLNSVLSLPIYDMEGVTFEGDTKAGSCVLRDLVKSIQFVFFSTNMKSLGSLQYEGADNG